jgi:hypothetical protein
MHLNAVTVCKKRSPGNTRDQLAGTAGRKRRRWSHSNDRWSGCSYSKVINDALTPPTSNAENNLTASGLMPILSQQETPPINGRVVSGEILSGGAPYEKPKYRVVGCRFQKFIARLTAECLEIGN